MTKIKTPRDWMASSVLAGLFSLAAGAAVANPLPEDNGLAFICADLETRGTLALCHDEMLTRHGALEQNMVARITNTEELETLRLHIANNNDCVAYKYASSALERDKVDIGRKRETVGMDVSGWVLSPALEHTANSMFQSGAACFDFLANIIDDQDILTDTAEEYRALAEEMRTVSTHLSLNI